MPCREWFDSEPPEYRASVLPPGTARVSVEAGVAMGWRDYVGDAGEIISIEHFGESAAGSLLLAKYGFNAEHVVDRARLALSRLPA
jgi:transketolase